MSIRNFFLPVRLKDFIKCLEEDRVGRLGSRLFNVILKCGLDRCIFTADFFEQGIIIIFFSNLRTTKISCHTNSWWKYWIPIPSDIFLIRVRLNFFFAYSRIINLMFNIFVKFLLGSVIVWFSLHIIVIYLSNHGELITCFHWVFLFSN